MSDEPKTVLPNTTTGVSEMAMHYDECLMWVDALEYWIRQQGLAVPTWRDVEVAGWRWDRQ